eukprot:gene6327-11760_t
MKVHERRLGRVLDIQSILNAYLHFDSLVEEENEFCCVICGCYPTVLIMDLNRKVVLNCSSSDLELPSGYVEEKNDLVDADSLWEKVELSMILKGFPNREVGYVHGKAL